VFPNRRILDDYRHADITVLRQACEGFKHEFLQIGNNEVFLEFVTIASTCNRVLRHRVLMSDTIRLIPAGGYTGNVKKALTWLVYREQVVNCKILNGSN
jgi:hypothetical protein